MKVYNNFKDYCPDDIQLLAIKEANPEIIFLKSEKGEDWYECQKFFSKDTMKIVYDHKGIILSYNLDASTLWPANASVAEISLNNVPEELSLSGDWVYNEGEIIMRNFTHEEYVNIAVSQRNIKLKEANEKILPLQDAIDLEIATSEEVSNLTAWKKYRVLLYRIDIDKAPDINWPDRPLSS